MEQVSGDIAYFNDRGVSILLSCKAVNEYTIKTDTEMKTFYHGEDKDAVYHVMGNIN
ncbi:hypothetical protein [Candidatus Williamhamiltonella defendens]|uniref:hypothetical protein n=1 Tax=Candidatus Williamhamiltonella defendens TaxID=138072 RepID=UPI00165192CE|nr:hypothetical protein [Candidatus Hamiltonella defensa]